MTRDLKILPKPLIQISSVLGYNVELAEADVN
jgi:hypothetical protein